VVLAPFVDLRSAIARVWEMWQEVESCVT